MRTRQAQAKRRRFSRSIDRSLRDREIPVHQVKSFIEVGGLLLVKMTDNSNFVVGSAGWEHRVEAARWYKLPAAQRANLAAGRSKDGDL